LIDWGSTAHSAQIGCIVPLMSMLQLTMLRVGNTYNKPLQ